MSNGNNGGRDQIVRREEMNALKRVLHVTFIGPHFQYLFVCVDVCFVSDAIRKEKIIVALTAHMFARRKKCCLLYEGHVDKWTGIEYIHQGCQVVMVGKSFMKI